MAQTAMVLVVVLSGFTGRYLMSHISQGLREKQQTLQGLQLGFKQMSLNFTHHNVKYAPAQSATGGQWNLDSDRSLKEDSVSSVSELAGGIADLEYSIAVHGRMKNFFQKWHRFHLVITGVLCFMLALHICSGVYYGLRWFQ